MSTFGEGLFGEGTFGAGGSSPVVIPSASSMLPQYSWQLLVRAPDRTFHGAVAFTHLELQPRYNQIGNWTCDLSWDGNPSSLPAELKVPGAGIAAVANGSIVMSGPVTRWIDTRDGDTRTLSLSGADDLVYLADKFASPQPATTGPPYSSQAYDVRSGDAETVIKQYVDVNAAGHAIAARVTAGLVVVISAARGTTVKGRARWQNLLELVQQLATAGGLGFKISMHVPNPATPLLNFDVYVPTDRTDDVVFAVELGNLDGFEYSAERPSGNYVFAADANTGTSRAVRESGNAPSVAAWGRIEAFHNASDTTDTDELDQAIAVDLNDKAAKYSFAGHTIDTGAHQWAPVALDPTASTYDLGDIVSVAADGQLISDVIREMHITVDASGTTVVPVVGTNDASTPAARFVKALVAEVRQLRAQVQDLQRS